MAKRLVCCPSSDANKNISYQYLYVDTSRLLVKNVTDELEVFDKTLKEGCCFDNLLPYALGDKSLSETERKALSFKFSALNSFELFKTEDELRFKTGSEKILHSCLLNYYRREYDSSQQYAFLSEPSVSNTYVTTRDGVEHELTLENREFIKNKEEEIELETLDKGKTDVEREADAALAQAQAELEEAMAAAEAAADKKDKQKAKRKAHDRLVEEERYRELRNQDNVKADEYQRLRRYEEEMRLNNDYLASQYSNENYQSLPGYVPSDIYSNSYESVNNETLGFAVSDNDLYRVASRLDEFGVEYTVSGETLNDGSHHSVVYYTTEYAEAGSQAIEFFELEKQLHGDNVVGSDTYFNAFQLSALDYAYDNFVDASFVSSGDYNSSQMYRIIEAGLNGQDMSVLANPEYSPAHMDALSYYMQNGWDTSSISDPTLPLSGIAESLMREEFNHNIPKDTSFFEKHDYNSFLSYRDSSQAATYTNAYDSSYRKDLRLKEQSNSQAAQQNYEDFKENVHQAYEYSQKEMNYTSDTSQPLPNSPANTSYNNLTPPQLYSFGASYTPTGYNSSNSTFNAYNNRKSNFGPTPTPSAGGSGGPQGSPKSNKIPLNNKYPLDELKVRSNFAKSMGLRIQNYGSSFVNVANRTFHGSFHRVAQKISQSDESGTLSAYHRTKRTAGNIVYTAHLIADVPRMFARAGQGVSYTANAIANVGRWSVGNDTVKCKCTPLTHKAVASDIKAAQKNHFNALRKEFGEKAARMNIKEINSNIKQLNKEKTGLINTNRKLKAEIKDLKSRGVLDAKTQKQLKDKLRAKKANERKIAKKSKSIKELNKLKNKKNAFCKELKDLKAQHNRFAKKAGRLKHLPGRVLQSFVSQLNQAGENITIGGIASASNFAMSFARNPLVRVFSKGVSNFIIRPITRTTKKVVTNSKLYKTHQTKKVQRKTIRQNRRKIRAQKMKSRLNKRVDKTFGVKRANKLRNALNKSMQRFSKINKTTKKVFKAVSAPFKFVSKVFTKIGAFFNSLKLFLIKAIAILLGVILLLMVVVQLISAMTSAFSSVMMVDKETDDGRIDISSYVSVLNKEQKEINNIVAEHKNNTEKEGGKYKKVYVNYLGGANNNNYKEILSMAAIYFQQDLSNDTAVNDYIVNLFNASNYVTTEESSKYYCSGCETREYKCTDKLDKYASDARKKLHDEHSEEGGCTHINHGTTLNSPADECDSYYQTTINAALEYVCNGHTFCSGHTEKICKGHIDLYVNVVCLGFDKIFSVDPGVSVGLDLEDYKQGDLIGTFNITYYCAEKYPHICNSGPPYKTATNTVVTAGRTIAVDPDVIPLNSKVIINGHLYVAEDTGGAIDGKRIDIAVASHQEALSLGRDVFRVYKASEKDEEDDGVQRDVVQYMDLGKEAVTDNLSLKNILQIFGRAKDPTITWKHDRVNADDANSFVEKLQKFDEKHKNEKFTNAELNAFEYVKMSKKELQKLAKKRGTDCSDRSVYDIITSVLIPYDKDNPDVFVNSSSDEEAGEEYYFEGWNADNKELVKNIRKHMTSDLYAGLDEISQGSAGEQVSLEGVTIQGSKIEVEYYSQHDARWANKPVRSDYPRYTISAAGCGPSSMSIVVSSLTSNSLSPLDMCNKYGKSYYQPGAGSYWSIVPGISSDYGLSCKELAYNNVQGVINALKDGKLVVAVVGSGGAGYTGSGYYTGAGHFLVICGVTDDGKFLLADPDNASVSTSGNGVKMEHFMNSGIKTWWAIGK